MYHYAVHRLPQTVLAYIRKHDLLRPGDRAGVAVSGGADSAALLRVLLELRGEMGVVLSVVHLNHCLRGEESDGDEHFVRELAARYDLPFHITRCNVKAHAAKNKLSLETAARQLRYQYFEELLRKGEFNRLATAHTLDDQAETVLLKLTRGAGTRGLAGIYPLVRLQHAGENLAIVRPLLAVPRSDLESYLAAIHQPWREDSTNHELHHTRNRIRHEILPRLIEHVNPEVRRTLAEAAELARGDEEFWQQEMQRHIAEVWSRSPQGGTLDVSRIHDCPLALARRLVRATAESLGLALEFTHVEEILALSHEGARTALPSNWTANRHRQLIHFEHASGEDNDYEYPLSVPGSVELSKAGLILVASFSAEKAKNDRSDRAGDLLDQGFATKLTARNWRAGDRFWPANTREPKKIKELLQDRHITGDQKKRWPVIACGDEVVWLRGFGVRQDCRPVDGTGVLITEKALVMED